MTLGGLLALVCIIIGFVVGATDGDFLFGAESWFLAAIAIVLTLGGVGLGGFTFGRKAE